ncbi:MAG TPA: cytochrome c [Casimicrobiaceae bacterium]|nr:cytochrome c [Casimicrobiaceae bacterium]
MPARRILSTTLLVAASMLAASQPGAQAQLPQPAPAQASTLPPPYKVVDGFYVDPVTMDGFRAWRAAACDRCHGAYQQGLVGPSLIVSFRTLTKDDFIKTVTEGRLEKGMPSFKTSKMVMEHLDGLYAYLKGRSSGEITQYRVHELKERPDAGAAAQGSH